MKLLAKIIAQFSRFRYSETSQLQITDGDRPEDIKAPCIEVGKTYPIMFGHGPASALVERLAPRNDQMHVWYLASTATTTGIRYAERLDEFIKEIRNRAMYEACSVQSVEIPEKWLSSR